MSRPRTKRERWALVVMPSVIVTAVYVFGVCQTNEQRLRDLRKNVDIEKKRVIDPRMFAQQRLDNQNLKRSLDAEKAVAATLKQSGGQFSQRANVAIDRTKALARLAEIFEKHALILRLSQRENENQTRGILPPAFHDAWNQPARSTTASGPQVWRFELVGTYAAIIGCLDAVAELEDTILPLSVSLEPGDPAVPQRRWTLWIWI